MAAVWQKWDGNINNLAEILGSNQKIGWVQSGKDCGRAAAQCYSVARMRCKQRYIAQLDEVIITRDGDYAKIQYLEPGVPGTHLEIGSELAAMDDEQVLEL